MIPDKSRVTQLEIITGQEEIRKPYNSQRLTPEQKRTYIPILMSFVLRARMVFATCGRKATVASTPAMYPMASCRMKERSGMGRLLDGISGLHAEIVVFDFQRRGTTDEDITCGLHAFAQPDSFDTFVSPFDLSTDGPEGRTLGR